MTDTAWTACFRKRFPTVFRKAHVLKKKDPDDTIRCYILIKRNDEGILYHWNSHPEDPAWPADIGTHGNTKSMSPYEVQQDLERRASRLNKKKPRPRTASDDSGTDDEDAVNMMARIRPHAVNRLQLDDDMAANVSARAGPCSRLDPYLGSIETKILEDPSTFTELFQEDWVHTPSFLLNGDEDDAQQLTSYQEQLDHDQLLEGAEVDLATAVQGSILYPSAVVGIKHESVSPGKYTRESSSERPMTKREPSSPCDESRGRRYGQSSKRQRSRLGRFVAAGPLVLSNDTR